jgi:hypothetical protein
MNEKVQTEPTFLENVHATIETSIQVFKAEFVSSARKELDQEQGELQLGAMTWFMLSRLLAFRDNFDGPLSNLYFAAGLGDGLKDVGEGIDYLADIEIKLRGVFESCNVKPNESKYLITYLFGEFRHIYEAGITTGKKRAIEEAK